MLHTACKTEIIYPKNVGAQVAIDFTYQLPAEQHCQFGPILRYMAGLDWQCCLAGSSKTAPRIFSIAMGADYSFYVKFIATYVPTFLGIIIQS